MMLSVGKRKDSNMEDKYKGVESEYKDIESFKEYLADGASIYFIYEDRKYGIDGGGNRFCLDYPDGTFKNMRCTPEELVRYEFEPGVTIENSFDKIFLTVI